MFFFIFIILFLLLDFYDHKSNAALYAERENMFEKELYDTERHEEIIKNQQVGNTINYQNLIYLEHIVKKLSEMPEKDKKVCKQVLKYIKQAKDGSFEAYEAVQEFVVKEHWVNNEKKA